MGKKNFYDEFDSETLLKLDIFRKYTREWLSVFMTNSGSSFDEINIFDFFAGKGSDSRGNSGSPLIIIDEIIKYREERFGFLNPDLKINLFFNDKNPKYIEELKKKTEKLTLPSFISISFSSKSFSEIFKKSMLIIKSCTSPNLLIMDQFGFGEITKEIVTELFECPFTDFLFFISSSNIRRFIKTPKIMGLFHIKESETDVEHYDCHRFICEKFKQYIPKGKDFYLSPFSLSNQSNINGLIFGSGSLLGLDKFLRVAWNLDKKNGEANYNIGKEDAYTGQMGLFDTEPKELKKKKQFQIDLEKYLKDGIRNNLELYKFSLENGFLPKHIREALKELQGLRKIRVIDRENGEPARKGAFYISWDRYKTYDPKVLIEYIG